MTYIIFDLEATCDSEGFDINQMEVIEIGAVALNEQLEIIGEYDAYIRPTLNPQLTEFCTALTGITQEQVDAGDTVEIAFSKFIDWALGFDGWAEFVSWGMFDKAIFERQVRKQGKHLDPKRLAYFTKHHFSVKHRAKNLGLYSRGLEATLKHHGIKFEGRQHNGLVDAQNIAKLFKLYFNETVTNYKKE